MSYSFDNIEVPKTWSDKKLQLYHLVRDWVSGDILTEDDEENIYFIFKMSFSFDDIVVSKTWSDKQLQLYHLVRDWVADSGDILSDDNQDYIFYVFSILPEDLHPDDGLVFLKILREIGLPDFGWIRSWMRRRCRPTCDHLSHGECLSANRAKLQISTHGISL